MLAAEEFGSGGSRVAFACVFAFLTIVFLFHSAFYLPLVGIDDANIARVYAANLASGHGWVYFPGTERVEGTTSLLQVGIWYLALRTPYPLPVMHVIHFLFCLLAIWMALRILASFQSQAAGRIQFGLPLFAYLCWLALNPGVITWSTMALMDVSLWTLLILSALAVTCALLAEGHTRRYATRMSVLAFIMVLTRPEAMALVPFLVLTGGLLFWLKTHELRTTVRTVAIPLIVHAAATAGLICFRLSYFGYPLPNTYYAKLSPHVWYNITSGLNYIGENFQVCPMAVPLLVVLLALAIRAGWRVVGNPQPRPSDLLTLAVAIPAMALVGIAILNGGDHFAQGRFLVQFNMLLPIPALALIHVPRWPTAAPRGIAIGFLAVATAAALDVVQLPAIERVAGLELEYRIAERGLQTGNLLNHAFPGNPKPTIGVVTAGGIAVAYGGYVVDLLGLNNTRIAHANQGLYGLKNHAAFHRPTFYALLPDLLLPRPLIDIRQAASADCTQIWAFEELVTRRVMWEPEFAAVYAPVSLVLRSDSLVPPSPLLRAQPAFLRPFMEPPVIHWVGTYLFVKKSLLGAVNREAFDVTPLACVNAAAPPRAPSPPRAEPFTWIEAPVLPSR
jgi:hypothetical protein